jgi:O-antigen/teichoic acid export membrane protein
MQLLVGRLGALACGYAITVLLARGLGPAEYGVYGVIVSVLAVLEMAAGLGIPGAATKLIPEHEADAAAVARTATFLLAAGSLALFAALWVLAPLLARALDIRDGAGLFRLAFVDLPLSGLVFAYQAALYGHRRFGAIGVSLAVYAAAKLTGVLALLALGMSVAAALVVNALGTLGAVLFLVGRVDAPGLRPSARLVAPLLRLAVPIGTYTVLAYTLMSVDLWILKAQGGAPPEAIGGYVAALNVARVLGVVPAVLTPVVFASVCRALARGDEAAAGRHVQGSVRFAAIVAAPACALIALDGEAIMVAIYSELYAGSGGLLALQVVGFGALAVLDPLLQAALASGQYRRGVGVLAALIPLAVIADVGLVGRLGALGAAIGLAGILSAGAAAALALARARFGPVLRTATLARVLAAVLVVAVVGRWLEVTGPWLALKLALLVGLYVAVLAAAGELRRRDVRALGIWRTTAA